MTDAATLPSTRYAVRAVLREGPAPVYRVADAATGEEVVLRVAPELDDEPVRFGGAMRVLAEIAHPAFVAPRDHGRLADGRPYVTADWVPGPPFSALTPLPAEAVMAIVRALAGALDALHRAGWIHGDVQPAALRLAPGDVPLIASWSRMVPEGSPAAAPTPGSLPYRAPEAVRGEALDRRADVYGLGAVAYALLTGAPPVAGPTRQALMQAIAEAPPQRLGDRLADVPAAFDALVMRMLAKAPAERPATMGEVLAALGEAPAEAAPYLPMGPMAGREAALAAWQAALEASRRGESGAIAVAGAPGMGKSRLLAAFRHQADMMGFDVVQAAAAPRQAPYAPLRALLDAALPLARGVRPALGAAGPVLHRLDPELAASLGAEAPAGPIEPEREQALIQEAIAAVLAAAARGGRGGAEGPGGRAEAGRGDGGRADAGRGEPAAGREAPPTRGEAALRGEGEPARRGRGLVVLLDDWQHADAPSRAALAYVARAAMRPGGAPICFAVASAPDAPPPAADAGWEAIALDGLAPAAFGAWLDGLFGPGAAAPAFAEALHAYAGGNPGVAREALRHLVLGGAIAPAPAGWRLPAALDAAALPAQAHGLVNARMAGLPAAARDVATLAALAEGPVDAALAGAALGVDEAAFHGAARALLQAGVAILAPDGLVLASPLLAALLVSALPLPRAAAWHQAVADALAARLPADAAAVPLPSAVRIARHRLAGADPAAAVRWGLEAGARCQDLLAVDAGDALIMAARDRLSELPAGALPGTRAALALRAARSALRRRALDEAGPLFAEAAALAGAEEPPVQLAEVLASQAAYLQHLPGGEARQRSLAAHEQAMEVAATQGDLASLVRATVNLARLHAFAGSADKALALLDGALAYPPERAPQAHARGLALRGHLRATHRPQLRDAGYEDLAAAAARQGAIGDKYGRGYTMSLLADLYLQAGRWRDAAAVAEAYVELMAEIGMADDHTLGLVNHALARLELGELDRAYDLAKKALAAADACDHTVARAVVLPVLTWLEVQLGRLAAAHARIGAAQEAMLLGPPHAMGAAVGFIAGAWVGLGQPQQALAAAQEAQFQLRGHDHGEAALAVETLLAEVYVATGQADLARGFAERAIDGATVRGARGLLARAALAHAQLALAAGDHAEAGKRAEQALTLANATGARRLAALAHAVSGEARLHRADPEAAGAFQAMQVLADEVGSPQLRAQALDGLARCHPLAPQAATQIADAQRLLQGTLRELPPAARAAVEALPAYAPILARRSAVEGALTLSSASNQQMVERLGRVSADLQSITAHYGLLIREWMAKSAQLEKLNALSRNINGSLDRDAVVDAILDVALELTGADRAFVLLKSTGRYEDLLVAGGKDRHGRDARDQRFSMTICQRVYGEAHPIAILEGMAPDAVADVKSIVALNLKTVMCAPLVSKGRRLGVIYVDSQAALRTYTLADLDHLQAIAAHASTALDNAQLYDLLARRTDELEEALDKVRAAERAAGTDMLTGLRNRRSFLASAARELGVARRYNRSATVVMVDVDHFKQFNDTYGHAMGDEVLRAVGRTLQAVARETDLPARLGGEEFVVLCPETGGEAAVVFAERLRKAIMEVVLTDASGNPIRPLTVSCGVAAWTPEDPTIDAVIARADAALYAAKRGGRNQVRSWTPDLVI